MYLINYVLS